MDDVVDADGGELGLGEAEHLLAALVEGDDAQVQLVLRLEHHLAEELGEKRKWKKKLRGCSWSPGGRKRRSLPPSGASPAGWVGQRVCRCRRGREGDPPFSGSDRAAA